MKTYSGSGKELLPSLDPEAPSPTPRPYLESAAGHPSQQARQDQSARQKIIQFSPQNLESQFVRPGSENLSDLFFRYRPRVRVTVAFPSVCIPAGQFQRVQELALPVQKTFHVLNPIPLIKRPAM